jgi:hypothetical protein
MLIIIPTLFILIVRLTSSKDTFFFQLGIGDENNSIEQVQGNLILVFVTLATIGFLASFLALNVTQQYNNINRRLVICGYYSFRNNSVRISCDIIDDFHYCYPHWPMHVFLF